MASWATLLASGSRISPEMSFGRSVSHKKDCKGYVRVDRRDNVVEGGLHGFLAAAASSLGGMQIAYWPTVFQLTRRRLGGYSHSATPSVVPRMETTRSKYFRMSKESALNARTGNLGYSSAWAPAVSI